MQREAELLFLNVFFVRLPPSNDSFSVSPPPLCLPPILPPHPPPPLFSPPSPPPPPLSPSQTQQSSLPPSQFISPSIGISMPYRESPTERVSKRINHLHALQDNHVGT